MKLIVRLRPQQLNLTSGVRRVSAQMRQCEFGPVIHRHVDRSGGAEIEWVISVGPARVDRPSPLIMPPRSIHPAWRPRRTKSTREYSEGLENTLAHESLPT